MTFIEYTEKIKALREELESLAQERQLVCEHKNLEYMEGYTVYNYPDRGEYVAARIRCNDCGLYANEKEDRALYNKLRYLQEDRQNKARFGIKEEDKA